MGCPTQRPRSTYIEIIMLVSVQMHFIFGSSMIEPEIRALLANLLEGKFFSMHQKRLRLRTPKLRLQRLRHSFPF